MRDRQRIKRTPNAVQLVSLAAVVAATAALTLACTPQSSTSHSDHDKSSISTADPKRPSST
jgi:ABC-type oligopeptide transport system substrate-binding subunit